ncbi:hypothetical protein Plhal710r2_c006g0027211 [Plasmopara halstedii]
MKFRLSSDTFPEIDLAKEDMENMETMAASIVDAAIDVFERLQLSKSEMFAKRWKPIKRISDVTLYEDSSMRQRVKKKTILNGASGIYPLMAHGTTPGELNEIMFGLLNPTREEMLAISACTGSYITDCAELASIITPTLKNPLRSLQIKWSLLEKGPTLASYLIRPRDLCVRELHEYQIVRAHMSFCRLFRQKSEGQIETFMTGCVDAMGYWDQIYTSIVMTQIANTLLTFQRLLLNGRMKKLAWMLRTKKNFEDSSNKSSNVCNSCGRHIGCFSYRWRNCKLCSNVLCPHCRVPLRVAWKFCDNRKMLLKAKITKSKTQLEKTFLCRLCLWKIDRIDALDVANDMIGRTLPLLVSEVGVATTSATSIFSLINSDRFDRDCFFHI